MTQTDPVHAVVDADATVQPPRQRSLRGMLSAVALDLGPLRAHRDFRLLYVGQLVSNFGNMLTTVALLYQVFALTHSSLAVGLFGLVEWVPLLLLAFMGGALADALDRRRLVLVTEVGLMLLSGGLLVNALLPTPSLWPLYLVGALAAALASLQRPALSALWPRVVDQDEIVAAVALTKARQSVGQILGPASAGVLIATVGLSSAYAIDVATFVVSVIALWRMRAVPAPPGAARPGPRRVLEGLRYVRGRPVLIGVYLVDMVGTFFGWPYALFPALAVIYTRDGGVVPAATALGLLYAAPAAGALLASAASGWTRRVHQHGQAVVVSVIVWGIAIAGMGLAPTLPLALAFLALMGGANLISSLFRGAIGLAAVPDEMRGRLAGIELVTYTSGPLLGDVESGAVGTAFTPRISAVSGGLLCVLGVTLIALALPRLRRYDDRHPRRDVAERHSSSS